MIKLKLAPKPIQLTEDLQKTLTEEFKKTGKPVWNVDWLKKDILAMSFGKCCYSEIPLGQESNYMEVEHFFPKDNYPDNVMQWGNLLPSCKKCNATKGKHDTKAEPIVNPFEDDPKDYFYLQGCRYYAKRENQKAKTSIEKLALNDRQHFVTPRFEITERLKKDLEDRKKDLITYPDSAEPINRIKRLLKQGNRKKEYAALSATIILLDNNYQEIEKKLKEKKLWDEELTALKTELEFCALLP